MTVLGTVRAAWSDASDGDLRPAAGQRRDSDRLAAWVTGVTGGSGGTHPVGEFYWMDQVHGTTVSVVGPATVQSPDRTPPVDGVTSVLVGPSDALVSTSPSTSLVVLTADCASVALGSPEGVFGAVHAGWRGLSAGVIERTVEAMRACGATDVVGSLGPCIHQGCYEFSEADLAPLVATYGTSVQGLTDAGTPALDLPAAVSAALTAAGAGQAAGIDRCTACDDEFFSHRARGDRGRQAMVVWTSPAPADR